jgi:hypothetical protein
MTEQAELTGCQGCGYFQKLLDIPAECRNPIWRKLRDLAADMAEQLCELQSDLRACNQTTCAGKFTEDLLHWWEGEANG